MGLNETFAATMKHYREAAGLSQEGLASAAELDRTYISQLERGLKSPTLTTVQKVAKCIGVESPRLLQEPPEASGPCVPSSYFVRGIESIKISRPGGSVSVPASTVTNAINMAHQLIDDMYSIDLDIASILGMRNLSAFIGELLAAAMVKTSDGLFKANPHQDGYPDLLVMDKVGTAEWAKLEGQMNEKAPFSPFPAGGIEVKATCGSVPTPADCRKRGIDRPAMGDSRIGCMSGYDWKAHHRETNNLVGILWDFIDMRPRIVAAFYSGMLSEDDWGRVVTPKAGGGRTTSVSIMSKAGIRTMYEGWLCVLKEGQYRDFLNRRNSGDLIPAS